MEQSFDGHQHNGHSNGYVNGSGNRGYGRVNKPVYKRFWQVKGIRAMLGMGRLMAVSCIMDPLTGYSRMERCD